MGTDDDEQAIIVALEQQIDELEDDLKAAKDEIDGLKIEIDDLRKAEAEVTAELESVRAAIGDLYEQHG